MKAGQLLKPLCGLAVTIICLAVLPVVGRTEGAALRMRECKAHFEITREQSTFMGIDYATAEKVGLAPWLFNLYIDPKEQMPVGHRLNAWLASMGAEAKAHAATFKKYPPKDIGLSQ
ncbi:MAG: hypothetical protein WAM73_04920 [Desulfobacterales bacterium]